MGTDRYAYGSKLRRVDPLAKLLAAAIPAAVCLAAGSLAVCILTLVAMFAVCLKLGGTRGCVVLHLLRIPSGFLLLAVITIAVDRISTNDGLLSLQIGVNRYGVTASSLLESAEVFARAMAVVMCMYFFTLTTPMTDFTRALARLHLPRLFIELMEMIYRFIFVLTDTANRIKTAQASRLGYRDAKTRMKSTGVLASMVFLRAYRKSDKVFTALEARGYTGALLTAASDYESGLVVLITGAFVVCAQILTLIIVRLING